MGTFSIVLIWLCLCIATWVIASKKGRSGFGFFLLSIILSPIVGIIAALIASENTAKLEENQLASGASKRCPYCAEIIKKEATICKYCNKEQPEIGEEQKRETQKQEHRTSLKGKGVDVQSLNQLNLSGRTLLMEYAMKGDLGMVKQLLAAGSDKEKKSTSLTTAYSFAKENGHIEVADYINDFK